MAHLGCLTLIQLFKLSEDSLGLQGLPGKKSTRVLRRHIQGIRSTCCYTSSSLTSSLFAQQCLICKCESLHLSECTCSCSWMCACVLFISFCCFWQIFPDLSRLTRVYRAQSALAKMLTVDLLCQALIAFSVGLLN